VQTELANYVGPIAKVLVARIARQARSAPELYDLLAQEIDDAADRERFRKRFDA
jgi:hypothetical protein